MLLDHVGSHPQLQVKVLIGLSESNPSPYLHVPPKVIGLDIGM